MIEQYTHVNMQALAKTLWRQIARGMATSASHSSPIANVTIIGSGLMGSGIAQVILIILCIGAYV